jgi:hypothetical protein
MFCSNCGTQLPDGTQFCPGCGQNLSEVAVPPQKDDFFQETVLLEKMASAKFAGLLAGSGKVDGKLTVTTKRVIFKISRLVLIRNFNTIEILISDIAQVTKEKYLFVFPQVSIVLKSGEKYLFPLLSGGDDVVDVIERQMKNTR